MNPFNQPKITPAQARKAGPVAKAVAYLLIIIVISALLAVLTGITIRLWEWAV